MSSNQLYDKTIDPRWYVTAPSVVDDSTKSDQYINRLDTSSGTIFASHIPSTSIVTFQLRDSDDYIDLHRAYLKVQVALVSGTGQAITEGDIAALSNNIVGSMLSQARLVISNKDVESVNHVDVSSMISLLSQLSCEEYKSLKDMLFFYSGEEGDHRSLDYTSADDNCTLKHLLDVDFQAGTASLQLNPNYNGNFTARYNRTKVVGGVSPTITINYPLKYIFNFCKDLNKLLYKSHVDIHLTLTNDWNKCVDVVHDDAGNGFRPYIKYMSLRVPSMLPSYHIEAQLLELYLSEQYVHPIFTRNQLDKYTAHNNGTNRIEWRIGSFAGDIHGIYFVLKKKADENKVDVVHQVFDNAGVRSFQVRVGNKTYPTHYSMNIDFGTDTGIIDYADAYQEFLKGTKKLENRRDEQALVTYEKYPSTYPIYYLDLSKHQKTDATSSEEITLIIDLDGTDPYNVYALVEQEQMLLMQLTKEQKITIGNPIA